MNILLCFNDRFVSVARTLIISLMCHHRDLHFYIGYLSLSDASRQSLQKLVEEKCPQGNWPWDDGEFKKSTINRTIEFIEFVLPDNLATFGRFPIDVWTRCFIWEQLPVERLLYLDADTIVDGNLEQFYYDDLGDNLLKACPDYIYYCTNPAKSWWNSLVDLHRNHGYRNDFGHYCNSGVVLFNVVKMRAEGISSKSLVDYYNNLTAPLMMPDQDFINLYFDGRIKLANPYRYNMLTPPLTKINVDELSSFDNIDFSESPYPANSATHLEKVSLGATYNPEDIVIYHYSAKAKPNSAGYRHKFADVYWRYRLLDPFDNSKHLITRFLQPCCRYIRNHIPDEPFAFLKRKKK